jgi:hypothetical protein
MFRARSVFYDLCFTIQQWCSPCYIALHSSSDELIVLEKSIFHFPGRFPLLVLLDLTLLSGG